MGHTTADDHRFLVLQSQFLVSKRALVRIMQVSYKHTAYYALEFLNR